MKTPSVSSQVRKAVAKVATYHESLDAGIKAVADALRSGGLDAGCLDGIYCGEQGQTCQSISGTKNAIYVSWYRMQSGRFELTAYVS